MGKRLTGLGALYGALAVTFCAPLFAQPNGLSMHRVVRKALLLRGTLPRIQERRLARADDLQRRPSHGVDTVIAVAGIAQVAAAVRRSWRPTVLAAALGIAGFVYSAPKLLPVVQYVMSDQFWDTRGDNTHPDEMSTTMMARAYLDPYQYYGLKVMDDSQTWG